jgi:hypothetical protein
MRIATIIENNELFELITFNGIEIYRRQSDGYLNAGKMCRDNNKKIKDYLKHKTWTSRAEVFVRYTIPMGGGQLSPHRMTYVLAIIRCKEHIFIRISFTSSPIGATLSTHSRSVRS